jgi:hypothetical protein
MVNKLHIKFSNNHYWRGAMDTAMVRVSDTLKKSPNLVDLRFLYDWLGNPSGGCLSGTIRFVFESYIIESQSIITDAGAVISSSIRYG